MMPMPTYGTLERKEYHETIRVFKKSCCSQNIKITSWSCVKSFKILPQGGWIQWTEACTNIYIVYMGHKVVTTSCFCFICIGIIQHKPCGSIISQENNLQKLNWSTVHFYHAPSLTKNTPLKRNNYKDFEKAIIWWTFCTITCSSSYDTKLKYLNVVRYI